MVVHVEQYGNIYYYTEQAPQQLNWDVLFSSIAGIVLVGAVLGMVTYEEKPSPEEELKVLNLRIRMLEPKIEDLRELTTERREHRDKLMKKYSLTVTPPEAQMREKYRDLYFTQRYLKLNEQELDRMETRMLLMMKRRKELQVMLGMRPEEEPRHRVRPYTRERIHPEETAAYWHEES